MVSSQRGQAPIFLKQPADRFAFVFSRDYINQLQRTRTMRTVKLMEKSTETVRIVRVLPIKIAGSAVCQIIIQR